MKTKPDERYRHPHARRIPVGPIVIAALVLCCAPCLADGPDLSQFDQLKAPRIATKESEKVLLVETQGDPNVVGGRAFGLLFQLYYSLPETPKGPLQAFPRARWPESLDAPKSNWTGMYALPVPHSVTALPQFKPQEGLKVSLATWEYGEVAEILHRGSYSSEEPTLTRLKEFIKEQGYVALGGHEEEYIVGPKGRDKGDPEKYVTILRYRVQKRLPSIPSAKPHPD